MTQDIKVIDESERDQAVAAVRYDITSYGIDFDVEGIIRRMHRGEILVPSFQREYVWNLRDASRFVESLLLGLPVPGIFLAEEPDTGKLLVIDGQQRLKSLLFFHEGVFNPSEKTDTQRRFRLTNVQEEFKGITYESLEERDRLKLDNSVIHATIVKQDEPKNDDTSIYHIFERLNSGGRRLTPQEIRSAIYHGQLIEMVKSLNEFPGWRRIFGRYNSRLKDQEMILRFLALDYHLEMYERPMAEFLNKFTQEHRNPSTEFLSRAEENFCETIDAFDRALSGRAFRPTRAFNAAVFDSMTVAMARRIRERGAPTDSETEKIHDDLLRDPEYSVVVSRSTGDFSPVARRIQIATKYFSAS